MLPHLFIHILVVCTCLGGWATAAATSCGSHQNRTTSAAKKNIWQQLSKEETAGLDDWVRKHTNLTTAALASIFNPSRSWNRTSTRNSTGLGNPVSFANETTSQPSGFGYELLPPKKSDALRYLDGNGSVPERFGQFGVWSSTQLQFFSIGPLPLSSRTQVHPMKSLQITLSNILSDDTMGYISADKDPLVPKLTSEMKDIIADLLGQYNDAEAGLKKTVDEGSKTVKWVRPP
jgi:hypothetical protein